MLNYLHYIIFDSLPVSISFISLVNLAPSICKLMLQDLLSNKCSISVEVSYSVFFFIVCSLSLWVREVEKKQVFSLIALEFEYLITPNQKPGFPWSMVSSSWCQQNHSLCVCVCMLSGSVCTCTLCRYVCQPCPPPPPPSLKWCFL